MCGKLDKLRYGAKTGEPLYPYAEHAYKHLHIVGHLFEDGKYLPVKLFVAPEMIQTEQGACWRKQSEKRGIRKGFWRGFACIVWFGDIDGILGK